VSKEKKPLGHDAIQQKVYEYIWNQYPEARRCFWHTPNEMIADNFIERSIIAAKLPCPDWIRTIIVAYKKRFVMKLSMRQSIGVLKGVTDLVFYWAGTLYMFDIKIGTDKLSNAQKDFIFANEAQGGKFFEISSVEQGKKIIDNIFTNKIDLTAYIPYFEKMKVGEVFGSLQSKRPR
jgi:hypothetical protein